jgi:hypothetical protein
MLLVPGSCTADDRLISLSGEVCALGIDRRSSSDSSTTNPTCPELVQNTGRSCGKPATNRLSYGTPHNKTEKVCIQHKTRVSFGSFQNHFSLRLVILSELRAETQTSYPLFLSYIKIYIMLLLLVLLGYAVAQWLRHHARNRKVAGSITDKVIFFFLIYLILPAALNPGAYSASNRNEYQKHKNNVSGE